MEKVIKDNWNQILNLLNQNHGISQPVIAAWVKPLKLLRIRDNVLYFLVEKDQRAIDFMKAKFLNIELLMAIQEFTENTDLSKIEFVLSDDEDNDEPAPYYRLLIQPSLKTELPYCKQTHNPSRVQQECPY